jgi:tripartite-type tricarboxylate transporter receptor subunit TctC
MIRIRMLDWMCMASALLATGAVQPAFGQTYPTQNMTLQVAFAAGGIADVVARLVGQRLSERLGHTVVVENRGGAGGNLAAKAVSGAAPVAPTRLSSDLPILCGLYCNCSRQELAQAGQAYATACPQSGES